MSVDLYQRYKAVLEATALTGRFMPYRWAQLPADLDIGWLAYSLMLEEFANEIANGINDLTNYAHRLKAWSIVVSTLNDDEKFDAVHEFIEPTAVTGLNLPYVIRSRFFFAIAHLSHQANRALDGPKWRDDLALDNEIYSDEVERIATRWRPYRRLRLRLDRIGNKTFGTATHDFRNAYNHRFSPRIEIGISQIVTRKPDKTSAGVTYVFGQTPSLQLNKIADLLSEQCEHSYAAFEAFQSLIREQVAIAIAPRAVPANPPS
jgi:hypothetical protein